LRDRLPTKANLANRGIIPLEGRLFAIGCGHVEDVNHLFLSCPIFGALRPLVRAWLGVDGVDPQHILDHLLQFIHCAGCLKSQRFFSHLIWLQCIWVLWNERNDRIFRDRQSSLPQMLDKVKSSSLW